MIGPGYLADNLEHGAPLPGRVKETFHLLRELDVASRLLTTRADARIGATEALPTTSSAGASSAGGGGKRKAPPARGAKGRGAKRGAAAKEESEDEEEEEDDVVEDGPHEPSLRALQQAALRCADEKIALAIHAYDLLDTQIRHIDSDLRRFERHYGFIPPILEEARRAAGLLQGQGAGKNDGGKGVGYGQGGVGGGQGYGAGGHGGGGGGHARRHSGGGHAGAAAAAGGGGDGALKAGEGAGLLLPGVASVGIDPNEPVYCFCRQVAYGEMVGCDNPGCEFEWFHFRCVGLTRQPTAGNRWLCPRCKRLEALPQHKKAVAMGGGGVSSAAVLEGILGGGGDGNEGGRKG